MIPKFEAFRDPEWIERIKTMRCILTGMATHEYEAVDPMHIGTLGRGVKAHDYWVLPVRHSLHQEGHNSGEVSMLRKHAPDWLLRDAFRAYAHQMWREAHD
jgi:hypothetical protein